MYSSMPELSRMARLEAIVFEKHSPGKIYLLLPNASL
jgi:hypothetical protein